MANTYEIAASAIEKTKEELNEVSQEIWGNPELSYEEFHAHSILTDFLDKKGFTVERKYKGIETAFRATFGEDAKPHVVIFCEYDGLPEIGHGCGHNLIAEVGVAAGLGIKAAMEATTYKMGKLTLLGSPAEEGGGGKVDLIKKGALKGVDVALMSHSAGQNILSMKSLSIVIVDVTYRGKASHASAYPWEGVNALDAAVLCYQNLSCLRQQLKQEWRLHGVILDGGVKPNIIPEITKLLYYLRAPTAAELLVLVTKATACYEAAAKATGCSVELNFQKNPYLNVLTNSALIGAYKEHAESLGVVLETRRDILDKTGGSTDMGNVSYEVPSIHPMFSISHDTALHTRKFTEAAGGSTAQQRTLTEGKILANVAIDVFTKPELLAQAKVDHAQDTEQHGGEAVTQLLAICS